MTIWCNKVVIELLSEVQCNWIRKYLESGFQVLSLKDLKVSHFVFSNFPLLIAVSFRVDYSFTG